MTNTAMPSSPYPLLLEPVLLEKVWGGRKLERLGKALDHAGHASARIGESWELADMDSTSASGAGGGSVRSTIANGPLRGQTLREAHGLWSDALIAPRPTSLTRVSSRVGHASNTRSGQGQGFPLLIKFLDASADLSVQVHPSPGHARANPEVHLKTECWYIVDAEPGAVIYKDVRAGVTRAEFERAARSADASIVSMLNAVPARVGELHNLPSGTIHALGAGVLVAEVQTPSDTTFRLYDWGRSGRALHIDEALASSSFPGEPGHAELIQGLSVASLREPELCARLVKTEFFVVDEVRPRAGDEVTIGYSCKNSGGCFALVVLSGSGRLIPRAPGAFEDVIVKAGNTVLVPAAISAGVALVAGEGLRALRVGV